MSASAPVEAATDDESSGEQLDLAAMFPADPSLMISLEGDSKGLRRLQEAAAARRVSLGFPRD